MRASFTLGAAATLILLVALPPLSPLLKAGMPSHILGQYAVIIASGAWIGAGLARDRRAFWSAAPALLTAALALGFWMLPRWVDASIADRAVDAIKVICLAALAGIPLGWGWGQAGPILRGFFLANSAVMLLITGWLLLILPARLCNAYLIEDQRMLGAGLLILAAVPISILLVQAIGGFGYQHMRAAPSPHAAENKSRFIS